MEIDKMYTDLIEKSSECRRDAFEIGLISADELDIKDTNFIVDKVDKKCYNDYVFNKDRLSVIQISDLIVKAAFNKSLETELVNRIKDDVLFSEMVSIVVAGRLNYIMMKYTNFTPAVEEALIPRFVEMKYDKLCKFKVHVSDETWTTVLSNRRSNGTKKAIETKKIIKDKPDIKTQKLLDDDAIYRIIQSGKTDTMSRIDFVNIDKDRFDRLLPYWLDCQYPNVVDRIRLTSHYDTLVDENKVKVFKSYLSQSSYSMKDIKYVSSKIFKYLNNAEKYECIKRFAKDGYIHFITPLIAISEIEKIITLYGLANSEHADEAQHVYDAYKTKCNIFKIVMYGKNIHNYKEEIMKIYNAVDYKKVVILNKGLSLPNLFGRSYHDDNDVFVCETIEWVLSLPDNERNIVSAFIINTNSSIKDNGSIYISNDKIKMSDYVYDFYSIYKMTEEQNGNYKELCSIMQ